MLQILGNEVDFAIYDYMFREVTLYIKPARTVLGCDMCYGSFEDEAMALWWQKLLGQLLGVRNRLGCPAAFPYLVIQRGKAREWLGRIAGWEFDTFNGGHMSVGINKERLGVDGKEAFLRCFEFLGSYRVSGKH